MIGLPVGEKPEERVCKRCGSEEVVALGEMTWTPRFGTWDPTGEIHSYVCLDLEGCAGSETEVVARPQA